MSLKNTFVTVFLTFLVLSVSVSKSWAVAAPAVLDNSIRPVEQSALAGAVDTRRPYISRAALRAEESAAPMKLELPLKMRDLDELENRVAHGEKISPQEMALKYEPSAQDYQSVVDWATSQKLTILRRDDHHLGLFVQGSVSQVASILGVKFARVTFRRKEFTSAITAPTVPASLSDLLVGINGLQPHLRPHKHSILRQAQPNLQSGGAEYRPKQIAQAYNATPLYANDIVGSGETIAIVIDTFPATSDLQLFWTSSGINQSLSNIQFIQTVAGSLPDPSGEESLDTEWASGMAPGAKVRVYAATDLENTDLDQTYQQVLDDATNHPELHIHQMTMSYGDGESDTSSSELDTDHNFFLELTAAGVTCFASSGDGGSTPDDNGGESGSLQPENPASDPNVTGVGGTSLILDANNNETSEKVWNDSTGAGGGGTSKHFARPSWQTGSGTGTTAKRQVPDIAATADPQYGGVVYVGGQLTVYGGTSLASPICAAICSLMNQALGTQGPIGFLNAGIYSQIGTNSFRDITSGNNATSVSNGLYYATAGYDECTGVGVPLAQALAQHFVGSSTLVGVQFPAQMDQVTPGQSATFAVATAGASATYQWQRQPVGGSSFSNLSDGGAYSGSTTATLTVANTTTAMSGDQFQCVVQFPSSTVTTAPPSNLAVETPLAVATLAGETKRAGSGNGTGTAATFNTPSGIALDSSGNLYIADYANNQIRKITPGGVVTTPFGSLSRTSGSTNGSGNGALFDEPHAIAADGSNNFYVADSGNNLIRKITGTTVSTYAGAGNNFNMPQGIGVDSVSGNVYVADTGNDTIRTIASNGAVSTLAGETGVSGYRDGSASQALFNGPEAIAVDGSGNVYVADLGNFAIRKISNGQVTTIAGTGGQAGYLDGRASSALFNGPTGLAFDSSGNLFISDSLVSSSTSNAGGNCVVRKLSPAGAVTTVAGNPGVLGSLNGTGTAAEFYSDQAVACAPGVVYVADTYNDLIRKVGTSSSATNGSVTLSNLAATYDGTPKSVTATTTPSGLTVNITYDGSPTPPTNAGSYTVVATISDPTYSGSASGTLVISKALATVTFGNLATTYDDAPQGTTVTTTPSGLSTVITYAGSSTPPTNAGSYAVLATVTDPNYTGFNRDTLVIAKAAGTVTLGNLNATYDGTVKTVTATTVPAGLDVVFTYDGGPTAPAAPGSYAVVGTINDANYTGSDSETLVIGKGTATITLGSLSAVYNGKPHAATATTAPAKLAVTLTYNLSATAPTVVGAYNVVATVNSADYAGTASGTLNITPVAPLVTTLAAAGVGAGSATLNGTANPEGTDTTVIFQYGTTTAYTNTTLGQDLGNGTVTAPASAAITDLASQTLYHYRAVATSAGGMVYGADKTFVTLAKPGYGTTSQAYLSASGAQLSFSVTPNGLATSVYFIYGTSAGNYTQSTAMQSIGSGKIAVNVMAFLSGLQPNTTYHFEVVIVSAAGRFDSVDQTFTTLGFDTTLVAQTGDVAPGTNNATYATFHSGAVNAQDAVAFAANLTATRSGPVTTANALGIWAEDSTLTRQLVARVASAAPDTNGALFATLTDPVYDNNEDIAFGGTLKVATGLATKTNDSGVWASSNDTLDLLARKGSAAPGAGGATFATFTSVAISDDGGAIVGATLAGTGVTTSNNNGVWEGATAANLTLMLRTGEETDSGKFISAIKFLPTETVVNGQTRGFGPTTGHLAANATYTDQNTGIVKVFSPGLPLAVATSGDAAADATGATGNGTTFATFSSPAINDNDHTTFAATLTLNAGGVTKANAGGIWADDSSGTRKLVAQLGQVAPQTGTSATFLSFGDPVYNANEAVAFRATLGVGANQATASTASGIWCNSTGALSRVAQQGSQAPSCPDKVNFLAFTELALDDTFGATQKGGVIFLATLSGPGVTTANNTGIFAVDATGTLQLIVRTGDVLAGKTVTAVSFLPAETTVNGQGRGFSQSTGDLVYTATFSDKTQAIFNVIFP